MSSHAFVHCFALHKAEEARVIIFTGNKGQNRSPYSSGSSKANDMGGQVNKGRLLIWDI